MCSLNHFLNAFRPMEMGLEERITKSAKLRKVRRSQFILRFGEVASDLYFVQQGSFFSYVREGDDLRVSGYKAEGEAVIEYGKLVQKLKSEEEIICFQDSIVSTLSLDDIQDILSKYSDFEFYLHRGWGTPSIKLDENPKILTRSYIFNYAKNSFSALRKYFYLPIRN